MECLRKKQFFMLLLGYGYKRNNLARLGGYPAHQNVADMSDFFYFDFIIPSSYFEEQHCDTM